MPYSLLITCEHAGNQIPGPYLNLFNEATDILQSHEGWDPGAWDIASYLGDQLQLPIHGCHVSRLVVEPNRSLDSPQLFSRFTNSLSADQKNEIIASYYLPYRGNIEKQIQSLATPVLHLSIHSFTPIFNGITRSVDIGLLFDPQRENELMFCERFKSNLHNTFPELSIQYNEPYKGIDDGLTTYLRTQHKEEDYLGIEIEVNQRFLPTLDFIKKGLHTGLTHLLYT